MSSTVHCDQTCSVPGRSIFSNLHLLRDLPDMSHKTDETGMLLTLDQEKAFDQVDHEFLMHTLTKFRFGPIFCQWVSLFYNRVFSWIICNGNLTQPIFLGRGVRQGCPLSPLLYVLVSQVLSTQIRECSQVIGFHLPGAGRLHFKISQYADDATVTFSSFACFMIISGGLVPSSIPPRPRQCGLGGSGTMAPPTTALNGSRK